MNDKTKLAIAATGVAAGLIARNVYRHSNDREISGEVVLIACGESGGEPAFALSLARRFAREGCRVALHSTDDLSAEGASVAIFRSGDASLIEEVTQHFGRIDILINGLRPEAAPGEIEGSIIRPTIAVLPQMIKRNAGKIVNITSSISKAAAGFSEGLRADLAATGVSVSTLDSRVPPTPRQVVAAVKRTEPAKTPAPLNLNSPNIRTLMMLGRLAARHLGQLTA